MRRGVVQTAAVLAVFTILFSCTLAVLGAKRQAINCYMVQEQLLMAKDKVRGCELNAALDFLYTIDTIMLSRNMVSYDMLLEAVCDKTFTREYEDGPFKVSFEARFSLKGFPDKSVSGLPEYGGTRFHAKIMYNISNGLGFQVYGEDSFHVSTCIDFTLASSRIDLAKELFESKLAEALPENPSLEQIRTVASELNELIKNSTGCEVAVDSITQNGMCFELEYRMMYPIVYESVFECGVYNNVYLYRESLLKLGFQ